MKKKIIIFLLLLTILISVCVPGLAATALRKISVELNTLTVKINDKTLTKDNIVYNGNVYIRADKVSDVLGKTFTWDKAAKTITIKDKATSPVSKLTANDYAIKLKAAGLPIGNIVVYTSANDPNKLLGRPNQYIGKVNFIDTTLEQYDANNPDGGSIEVFNNNQDTANRKRYIDSVSKDAPAFAEYSYINGKVLLRLSKSLTPEQAAKYETEFMKIK